MDQWLMDMFCFCREDSRGVSMKATEAAPDMRSRRFELEGPHSSTTRQGSQRSFALHSRSRSLPDAYSELYHFVKNSSHAAVEQEEEEEEEELPAMSVKEDGQVESRGVRREALISKLLEQGMQELQEVRRIKKQQHEALSALKDPQLVKGEELKQLEEARIRRHAVFRQKFLHKQSDMKDKEKAGNVDIRVGPHKNPRKKEDAAPPISLSSDSKEPRLCKVGCQCIACEHEVKGYMKRQFRKMSAQL
ncbi:hypothetical protein GUITHDRAFT_117849 [Guillardia theta CCMP2712]|uniref:Uncharacterized protein n=1 Tax=Guillardia theta (strain CCMP2712) TaxID=905079 RepID=L1IIL9_GUITC|nr:hypothetical protein GUITHDRAFT_117849 [Guillardia theta CCMP2712]EKX35937.1 hypothetical protein GUITHDRAFT_117849 [Guillardia theta CCMP2712]|eukprot:XP_005822917.1 hypothetical protein GUITHDRAFT_117849 [Guillardia theta CCMP2712]